MAESLSPPFEPSGNKSKTLARNFLLNLCRNASTLSCLFNKPVTLLEFKGEFDKAFVGIQSDIKYKFHESDLGLKIGLIDDLVKQTYTDVNSLQETLVSIGVKETCVCGNSVVYVCPTSSFWACIPGLRNRSS